MKPLSRLDTPRRLVVSAGLPTFVVLRLLQVEWRTDIRTRTTETGSVSRWDTAMRKDQPWSCPAVVLLVTGIPWLWWPPERTP